MIHFGKPWAECLAAILAGTVLGTLAQDPLDLVGLPHPRHRGDQHGPRCAAPDPRPPRRPPPARELGLVAARRRATLPPPTPVAFVAQYARAACDLRRPWRSCPTTSRRSTGTWRTGSAPMVSSRALKTPSSTPSRARVAADGLDFVSVLANVAPLEPPQPTVGVDPDVMWVEPRLLKGCAACSPGSPAKPRASPWRSWAGTALGPTTTAPRSTPPRARANSGSSTPTASAARTHGRRAWVLQVWRRQRGRFVRVYAGDGPARTEALDAWLVVKGGLPRRRRPRGPAPLADARGGPRRRRGARRQ